MKDDIEIYKIREHELKEVLHFYGSVGYKYGASIKDNVFAARYREKLAGIARICVEDGIFVLRGMQVAKEFQKQGIGKKLLQKIEKFIRYRKCYCLPYNNMETFYGKVGFKRIPSEYAPPHLQERLREYHEINPNIIIMKRAPTSLNL